MVKGWVGAFIGFLAICLKIVAAPSSADMDKASVFPMEEWEESEIWLIERDYVKFGKRDLYEEQKKQWNQLFASFAKNRDAAPILGIENLDSSDYIYLMPIKNYANLDKLVQLQRSFHASMSGADWARMMREISSTINFKTLSLHHYRKNCSYIPLQQKASILDLLYSHYHIYGIVPGYSQVFEEHLEKMVDSFQKKGSPLCWRVWKVVFGSDIPKYVLCIFAKTEEESKKAAKEIEFVDPSMKEIIRRHSQGEAVLRKDLTFLSGT